jgi:replicative DNA helicase
MNKKEKLYTFDSCGVLPPQALDVEKAIIGAIMIETAAFERICDVVTESMFYDPRHGLIYGTAMAMHAAREPIDMLTIVEKLQRNGKLSEAGGTVFIADLTTNIASTAHVERHAAIIKEKYIRRKLIELSLTAMRNGYDESEETDEVMTRLNNGIAQLYELMMGKNEVNHISHALKKFITAAYERKEKVSKGHYTGIPTGFFELDLMTNGWKANDLVVLAARPGAGKTAIAIHMAKRASIRGYKVALFTLEMGEAELTDRMIVGESGIDKNEYKSGRISAEDLLKAENAAFNHLIKLDVYINASPRQTALTIANKLRSLKKRGLCDMAIIDYLQLMKSPTKGRSRDEDVGEATRELKLCTKELNVPIILLSQMNREVEKRKDKVPVLSDLRESGSIEQDADMVIFIHNPSADGETEVIDAATGKSNVIQLFVRKNRDGQQGIIKVVHNETMTAFYDYDYEGGREQAVREYINPDRFHEPYSDDGAPF